MDVSGTPENPPSPLSDDARKALAMVHEGWDHLRRQRPLAAWASWQRALRIDPEHAAARQALEHLASAEDLPAAARGPYRFRPPRDDDHRARWDAALRSRDMQDLRVAAEVFGALADADPSDAPARYNQALCLAWLGENASAIEALDAVVRSEAASDFEAAVGAWTLAEVLRQGAGAEPLADDLSHSLILEWPISEGDPIAWLSTFATLRPLPTPLDPITGQPAFADVRAFEWLDREIPAPNTTLSVDDLPQVFASVIATPGSIRFSSPDREVIEDVDRELRTALGDRELPFDRRITPLPLALMDAAVWQFRLPDGLDEPTRHRLSREAVERYFEDKWIQVPRHGLADLIETSVPEEAPKFASLVGLPSAWFEGNKSVAQSKLGAVVRLREQLAARPRVAGLYAGYPFDRLRRRLGIQPTDLATLDPADVSCMGVEELEGLETAKLDDSTLIEALRSAEAWGNLLAMGRIALAIAERDPSALIRPDIPNLAVWICDGLGFHPEYDRALYDRALAVIDRAVALDEETNGGREHDRLASCRVWIIEEAHRRMHDDLALES